MSTLLVVKAEIDNTIALTVESIKGGLTWEETLILQKRFTETIMRLAALTKLDNKEKKAMVLEAIGLLFDALVGRISLLVLPWYLSWILWLAGPVIRPVLRQVFIAAGSSLIETLFNEKFKATIPLV